MRLNRSESKGVTKKNSQKGAYAALFLTVALFFVALFAVVCLHLAIAKREANAHAAINSSEIWSYLTRYGKSATISDETRQKIAFSMEPVTFQTNEVEVALREMIYDGVWLFTAAEIQPIHSDQVLTMPGAAMPSDPRSGIHGEETTTDTRSFLQAANEDGKKLLAVYVYPKEFDLLSEYFIDDRQLSDDSFVFLSGANIGGGNEPLSITWLLEIYEVDTELGDYTLLTALESNPQQVMPLSPVGVHEYVLEEDAEDAPFERIQLIQTAIATYLQPISQNGDFYQLSEYKLFQAQGEAVPRGAVPDIRAVALANVPETLILQLGGDEGTSYQMKRVTP